MRKHIPMRTRLVRTILGNVVSPALLLGLLAGAPPTVDAQSTRYSMSIQNDSNFDIYQLYVSSTAIGIWGPDQLESNVLGTGERFTLTNIRSGTYDFMLVDEYGDRCILPGIAIFQNKVWQLTNTTLLRCQRISR